MCGVGSVTTRTTDRMSGRRESGSRSRSGSSERSSPTNNNCSDTHPHHHFPEESRKMNGGGTSEKSEDGGRSTGSPASPAGHGGSGSGSASPNAGCPSCRQLLCSCGKSPNSAAGLLNYQRLASTVPSLVYPPNPSNPNAPPYSPEQVAYLAAAAAAAEQSALYAVAGGGLGPDMKEGGLGPSGWAYPSMYHPYDPSFAAAMSAAAAAYPFNGYSMDMNGSRRKNATRETTSTLKAWLAEHRKNPYPTKGEKIMLAIITKMTLTQVSTWFANARRRLKKENKMTWEPRNRPDDDDDDVNISDDEDDVRDVGRKNDKDNERLSSSTNSHHVHGKSSPTESSCSDVSKEGASSTPSHPKPRIWSVADLANDTGGGGGGHGSDRADRSEHSESNRSGSHHHHHLPHNLPPHHLIPHPHLLNLHNNHHHHSSSSASSNGSNGSAGGGGGGGGGHTAASAAAAAAAAAAAFLHNPHLRGSHHHLQQLHQHHQQQQQQQQQGSNHHHHPHLGHHPGSSLPGSAFSPLSRASAAHSEAIYRGLYPLSHPYHSSSADNP